MQEFSMRTADDMLVQEIKDTTRSWSGTGARHLATLVG